MGDWSETRGEVDGEKVGGSWESSSLSAASGHTVMDQNFRLPSCGQTNLCHN